MARTTPAAKAGHWLIVISTAGLPQAAGLGGPTNKEKTQILLVPDFPTPQLLLRAALPPLVPGEPILHPHPSWLAEEERQPRGSPYKGVGLGSYSVWSKGSPSARSVPQTVGRQPAAVLWALTSSYKL